MYLTAEQFAFYVVREVTALKHAYKSTIYGAIKAMRENYGYQCDATDDEIYELVSKALSTLSC